MSLDRQGIFDRILAADAATVVKFIVAGTDALNHNGRGDIGNALLLNAITQFQLGHHPLILIVKVFDRSIFMGACGHDDGPVVDGLELAIGTHCHLGLEIAFVPRKTRNQPVGDDVD